MYMATKSHATPSFSMTRQLHRRMIDALPRYGDRSKLVAHLLERWLDGHIQVYIPIKVRQGVAINNITS